MLAPIPVRITISDASRIRVSRSSHSSLEKRHSGRTISLSPLPKTPQIFSPGSTTCETLAHLETP